jgi:hypothetical protein
MYHKHYCEFPSGDGFIHVEIETELPNANTQIKQFKLDRRCNTEYLVWSPPPKGPLPPSTQESITTGSEQPSQMPLFQDYLKAVRLAFVESQNLKELLNSQSAKTTIERLIREFNEFHELIKCPEVKKQLEKLGNRGGRQVLFAQYSKTLLQPLCGDKNLEELFNKYSMTVKNLYSKSTYNLLKISRDLLSLTDDYHQNLSRTFRNLYDEYCTAIQDLGHSNYMEELLDCYSYTYEDINNLTRPLDYQKLESETVRLLKLLENPCSPIYEQIKGYQKITQKMLEICSAEFGITNDIE